MNLYQDFLMTCGQLFWNVLDLLVALQPVAAWGFEHKIVHATLNFWCSVAW